MSQLTLRLCHNSGLVIDIRTHWDESAYTEAVSQQRSSSHVYWIQDSVVRDTVVICLGVEEVPEFVDVNNSIERMLGKVSTIDMTTAKSPWRQTLATITGGSLICIRHNPDVNGERSSERILRRCRGYELLCCA
eukprot:6466676-Amphidinium_carterae.5